MDGGYTKKGEAHGKMTGDEIRLNLESLHGRTHAKPYNATTSIWKG